MMVQNYEMLWMTSLMYRLAIACGCIYPSYCITHRLLNNRYKDQSSSFLLSLAQITCFSTNKLAPESSAAFLSVVYSLFFFLNLAFSLLYKVLTCICGWRDELCCPLSSQRSWSFNTIFPVFNITYLKTF